MNRVADLYIRVSTDEQADKGYSLRDQEERLRRYCEIKNISVRNVYKEDHSAKTFNRPEWNVLISNLKKNKNGKSSSLLLFTKWDRFSRNVSQSYQNIDLLHSLRVEPQAIEQPLDMSIPESKIMMAHYLTIPEVENERRALNVFYGMRRARKEGRYMGVAPLGYVNKITEDKKKYIAIKEDEAELLRWVFDKIIENNYNTEQIWKLVKEKAKGKRRFSRNNLWVAIRNPLYCGKIFVPAFKDEEAKFVLGQHEPIISERKFNEVQEILDGRRRKFPKPKIVSLDKLPLRGFLKCPKCQRMLTGSASKSRLGRYYYYYHCHAQCGVRFRAELANEAFEYQLKELMPIPGIAELFVDAVLEDFSNKIKKQGIDRKQMLTQVEELNNRLQKALIQKVDGKLDDEDYAYIKKDTREKLEKLEYNLSQLSDQNLEIERLLKSEYSKILNLYKLYSEGDIEQKRQIIVSMFPENLQFDGTRHRTQRLNSAVILIYANTKDLSRNKKGISLPFLDLSQEVSAGGVEPPTFRAVI
ncbi:recombinase family protein [Chryseobacterium defluvii]|uniref:recombinase family protein n=1 Tax=Chryseobacterium defluvii TaxID=160396 RepID=UPI000EADEBAF|nr:recombinase family protein [Chryseobacterium defluvii]